MLTKKNYDAKFPKVYNFPIITVLGNVQMIDDNNLNNFPFIFVYVNVILNNFKSFD